MRGIFAVLEGGEGAGKTTLARALAKRFPDLLITRAGGTPLGEKFKALLVAEEYANASPQTQCALAFAAHADHVKKLIAPALAKRVSIVSDRFDASTFAYQVYAQKACSPEFFFAMRKMLLNGCLPDVYIFLDAPPEVGLSRIEKTKKKRDHFERRGVEFHRCVREGYLAFLKHVSYKVVDASRPLEAVLNEVFDEIAKRLNGLSR